jgi:hypothetical protein
MIAAMLLMRQGFRSKWLQFPEFADTSATSIYTEALSQSKGASPDGNASIDKLRTTVTQ